MADIDPSVAPYFDLVPTEAAANLAWRANVREAAVDDPDLQEALRQACFEDPLFFFAAFAWIIEPRGTKKTLPFLLWLHQVPVVLALVKSIRDGSLEREEPVDIIFDKSRAQGATWLCLYVILWLWLHEPLFAAGIMSRNMEAVDKKNDLGSLFPKLDWAIGMLPYWLRPQGFNQKRDRSITDTMWTNCGLGGTIAGTACTAEAFSGSRLSVLFYDEAAKVKQTDFQAAMDSTQHVTNVRWIVSTHYGDSGPFYDMVFGEAVGTVITLDWKDNPTQNKLAYRFVKGVAQAVNPDDYERVLKYAEKNKDTLEKLKRRNFIKEGKIRSPWYDKKCLQKGATPRGIAQDLDRDPRSTVGKLFYPEILDEMEAKKVRPHLWRGDAFIHQGSLKLIENQDGPLKLWFKPLLDGDPPKGNYVVGADIGTGVLGDTASNSVLEGGNSNTGEQVLEYVIQTAEARFAHMAVAICEWLWDAYLIWEAQGSTGKRFATAIVSEIGYWNIWKRPNVQVGHKTASTQLGWVNNRPADKRDLFGDFVLAMDDEEFIPRSAEMITECRGWEEPEPDKIIYKGATGHGDRAIAGGLCWKGMKEMRGTLGTAIDKMNEESNYDVYEYSLAGRVARREMAERHEDDDDFAGFTRVERSRW